MKQRDCTLQTLVTTEHHLDVLGWGWAQDPIRLGSSTVKIKLEVMNISWFTWGFGVCLYVDGGGGDRGASDLICHTTNLRTRVEPQQIVAQRLLSCLQYPVP